MPSDPEFLGCRGPAQHTAHRLHLGCSSGKMRDCTALFHSIMGQPAVKHQSYQVIGAGISVLVVFSVSEALGTKLLKTRGVYATKWFMHLRGTLHINIHCCECQNWQRSHFSSADEVGT